MIQRYFSAVIFCCALVGCGQQLPESVEQPVVTTVQPVVVQQCDEECQKVAQHRENQRRKTLDSAF